MASSPSSNFKYFKVLSEIKKTSKKFKVDVTTFKLELKECEFANIENVVQALELAFDEVLDSVLGQDRRNKIFRIVFSTPVLEDPISTLALPGFKYTAHTFLTHVERVLLSNKQICAEDPLDLQIICRDLTAEERGRYNQHRATESSNADTDEEWPNEKLQSIKMLTNFCVQSVRPSP